MLGGRLILIGIGAIKFIRLDPINILWAAMNKNAAFPDIHIPAPRGIKNHIFMQCHHLARIGLGRINPIRIRTAINFSNLCPYMSLMARKAYIDPGLQGSRFVFFQTGITRHNRGA